MPPALYPTLQRVSLLAGATTLASTASAATASALPAAPLSALSTGSWVDARPASPKGLSAGSTPPRRALKRRRTGEDGTSEVGRSQAAVRAVRAAAGPQRARTRTLEVALACAPAGRAASLPSSHLDLPLPNHPRSTSSSPSPPRSRPPASRRSSTVYLASSHGGAAGARAFSTARTASQPVVVGEQPAAAPAPPAYSNSPPSSLAPSPSPSLAASASASSTADPQPAAPTPSEKAGGPEGRRARPPQPGPPRPASPYGEINALVRHPTLYEPLLKPRFPIVLCHGASLSLFRRLASRIRFWS